MLKRTLTPLLDCRRHRQIWRSYATAASPPPPSPRRHRNKGQDNNNNNNNNNNDNEIDNDNDNKKQDVDHHKRLDLHSWPSKRNPTPYEIFNVESKDINISTHELNKILKKTYIKFVKIYHPDTNQVVFDDKGKELTTLQKRNRFDQIQSAYDILKNPRRRVAYNRYSSTNWDQQGQYAQDTSSPFNKDNFEAYRRAHAHRTKYSFDNDESFWQAGTWEDYYKMKYGRKPPTKEELDKNKYKILFGVVAVGVLSFGIQVMLAIDSSNEYYTQTRLMNLKSAKDLQDSAENYGEGSNQLDRLRRFLLSRRSSLAIKQVEDKSPERDFRGEEDEMLVRYAQKRVSKWD